MPMSQLPLRCLTLTHTSVPPCRGARRQADCPSAAAARPTVRHGRLRAHGHVLCIVALVVLGGSAIAALGGEARVRLNLVGEGQGIALDFQEWARTLGAAGIRDVRLSSGAASPGIQNLGTADSPYYVVTGVVKSRDELLLPGGRYRRSDVGRLVTWLDNLARQGPESERPQTGAFGLTGAQYQQVHNDLSQMVSFATADQCRLDVVDRIARGLTFRLTLDPSAREALAADKVTEQLTGLGSGTALACVLRPAGYCLVPGTIGGQVGYGVLKARAGLEIWPVGWQPQKAVRDLVPGLYEFHNINIQVVAVEKVVAAIAKNLKTPVLYDHNAMARHGIDPATATVSHPNARTTYSLALRKLLFQAGLKFEVRVDETDSPLLWITTVKPM